MTVNELRRKSAELVDEPKDEKPDLSKYSTMELLQELVARAMRDE
jgi:hypothetical protein